MSLSQTTEIGRYEVVAPLGAGGMGEVYRARDTRLNRKAAIKVRPQAFAEDSHRMARFEREAQLLASLNHPKIAASILDLLLLNDGARSAGSAAPWAGSNDTLRLHKAKAATAEAAQRWGQQDDITVFTVTRAPKPEVVTG